MTTLHIRTDAKLKREVKKILAALGLDLSAAVTMFLREVVRCKGLPLPLATIHGFTAVQEEMILRAVENAKKRGKQKAAVGATRRRRPDGRKASFRRRTFRVAGGTPSQSTIKRRIRGRSV